MDRKLKEIDSGIGDKKLPHTRVFIVGCPRSGTTVLQSALVNHTDLIGFPESNILYRLLGDLPLRRFGPDRAVGRANLPRFFFHRMVHQLGLTLQYDPKWTEDFLVALERQDVLPLVPKSSFSLHRSFGIFARIFDQISGGRGWIDKSPDNVFCAKLISQYIPQATIIHIIRDGRDTVASCVAAGRKHRAFEGRFGGPDGVRRAVLYWNRAVLASNACVGRRGNYFVRYEDFVENPRGTLTPICNAIGIMLNPEKLTYNLRGIARPNEAWKVRQSDAIVQQSSRFYEVLTASERSYVEANIRPVDELFPRAAAYSEMSAIS